MKILVNLFNRFAAMKTTQPPTKAAVVMFPTAPAPRRNLPYGICWHCEGKGKVQPYETTCPKCRGNGKFDSQRYHAKYGWTPRHDERVAA